MKRKTITDVITSTGSTLDGRNFVDSEDFEYTVETFTNADDETSVQVLFMGHKFTIEEIEKVFEDMQYLHQKEC